MAGRARALSLARSVLPAAIRHRLQAQPVGDGEGAAALCSSARSRGGLRGAESVLRRAVAAQLRVHRLRLDLSGVLSEEPRSCDHSDRAAAAHWLPARLRHGARPAALAAAPVHGGRAAVLGPVSYPPLCPDQRLSTPRAALTRASPPP